MSRWHGTQWRRSADGDPSSFSTVNLSSSGSMGCVGFHGAAYVEVPRELWGLDDDGRESVKLPSLKQSDTIAHVDGCFKL